MRKFLLVLLIAVIACNDVDTLDFDDAEFRNIFQKIGDFFGNLWNKVKGVVQKLKDWGVWDSIVKAAKTVGKLAAKALCNKYDSSGKCGDIVDKFIK